MTERTIVLTDADAALLDRLVESGDYHDAGEALHHGLKLAELARTSDAMREAAFRAAIQVGIDDVEAGRVTRFTSADEIEAHFLARPLPNAREQ
jgi:antitoxin ParD1/3/4